jgi:uncharacterized protein YciI
MEFVVIARDGTDADAFDRRRSARPVHLEGIRPFVERGEIRIGGAILDDDGSMVGSVLLADFPTRADLDRWLEGDPYVTLGVWQQIEVHPFRTAVGAWFPGDRVASGGSTTGAPGP